jgi:hypothetical protein
MDEEKDLETQESLNPENEDGDSQETDQASEPDEKDKKIADLEEKNKQLFARAKKAEEKGHKETEEKPPVPQVNVDEIINQKFEERDLASLDFDDDVKGEIRAYAKAKGVSIQEATKSKYIGFLKSESDEKRRELEASASSKGGSKTAKRDFSSLADDDLGKLSDEDYAKYKEWLKTQG